MIDVKNIVEALKNMPEEDRVNELNNIREALHEVSPFKNEPIDFVRWIKTHQVQANDYNPNKVAPPEMRLLEHSIDHDGFTQPVVGWRLEQSFEVVDGFHRTRVAKESKSVRERLNGWLPIVAIQGSNTARNDRIASTIRHNRARGKHQINAMSEIVIELKNRNWTNQRIARELGMDEEEVLRLCQISGLEHLFSDKDFSRAWEADDSEYEFMPLSDEVDQQELDLARIPNEGKGNRIFHTYDKWECQKAGFYASRFDGMSDKECKEAYRDFLADADRFKKCAYEMTEKWVYSCEHYLTNFAMNRIAWIGQASMCYATGVPSKFCSGFNLLSEDEKKAANEVALEVLNHWLKKNGRDAVDMDEAMSFGRQVEIY